jgi:hypothetical protein
MSAVRPSGIRDERDVACPKARPDPDVMLVRSFSTTSRPASGRPAAALGRHVVVRMVGGTAGRSRFPVCNWLIGLADLAAPWLTSALCVIREPAYRRFDLWD